MYISHSSKIPGQPRDELQWEEEEDLNSVWWQQTGIKLYLYILVQVCLCYAVLSVPCSHVVCCQERTDLLALLRAVVSCLFDTFSYVS